MEGEWGRGRGVEIGCIQWDVDRVVSGEKGDEMNGDVQWFVCLDRDGESDCEGKRRRRGCGNKEKELQGWAVLCEEVLQCTDVA